MFRIPMIRRRPLSGAFRLNCMAALISGSALCVLVLNFHATPAGAGADPTTLPPLTATVSTTVIPLPATPLPGAALEAATPAAQKQEDVNRQIQAAIQGSRLALQLHATFLELGKRRIDSFADYTGTFVKHERLDNGTLQEVQTIQFKLRHKPFSVYMKWLDGGDKGREVLFVDGQYDNKMLVRMGGVKGKFMPAMKIDPSGSLAMQESRHPVSDMGLSNLAVKLISYRQRDIQLKEGVRWDLLADQQVCGRECHRFDVEYANRTVEPVYRKSITFLDKEWLTPLCVKNFGWPAENETATGAALDDKTMIEYYGYTDIKFDQRLTDADFDRGNAQYAFKSGKP